MPQRGYYCFEKHWRGETPHAMSHIHLHVWKGMEVGKKNHVRGLDSKYMLGSCKKSDKHIL
mgnify:FL=1